MRELAVDPVGADDDVHEEIAANLELLEGPQT
jgi:hypothetical protein